jgi:hypothetical protein
MRAARTLSLTAFVAFGTLATLGVVSEGHAAPVADFQEAVGALSRGAYGDAVDRLELLADQGFVHPDASYDRAIAYLGRARSPQRKDGDLGRAVHAFSEALLLRPSDRGAEAALEAVRSELARRHAREGGRPLVARPKLTRAIAGLLPEVVWGLCAALGAASLSLGIALRLVLRKTNHDVAAALAIGVGALLFVLGGALSRAAFHFETGSAPAVVVAPSARLLDALGRPVSAQKDAEGTAIPEGSDVFVLERAGGLALVEWGNAEAWVLASQVRELSRPSVR